MPDDSSVPELLTVIIPVYNEHTTVLEVIEKIYRLDLPIAKEIIVVDDGSDDGTSERLLQFEGEVRIFTNPVNEGKGSAVRTGIANALGDIILIQDADLETNPSEYEHLLGPILKGEAEVVYGSRFLSGDNRIPLTRAIANRFLTGLTNVLYGSRLTDMETAYKVFTSEVASRMELRSNRFEIEPEITAILCRLGYDIREVPVSYSPRTRFEGKKIRFRDGIKAAATVVGCRFRKL